MSQLPSHEPEERHGAQEPARPTSPPPRDSPASPDSARAAQPDRSGTPRSIERIRLAALVGLFVLAVLYAAYVARAILQPLVVAGLLYCLLHPVVRRLSGAGVPVALASALVVGGLAGAIGLAGYHLADPAANAIEQAPRTLRQIGRELRSIKSPAEDVSEAAEEAEKIGDVDGEESGGKVEVTVAEPGLADSVWTALQAVFAGAIATAVLLFFLLIHGERLLELVLRSIFPGIDANAEPAVHIEIERRVSVFLGTFCLENFGLATVATLLFWLLEMPNPIFWGVLGGMFNFIPYLGPLMSSGIVGLVGYAHFRDVWQSIYISGAFLALTAFEGTIVQPVVFGRSLSLNPLVIFLAVAFGMWFWGIIGALVAVPSLIVIRAVCDQFSSLKTVSALLS